MSNEHFADVQKNMILLVQLDKKIPHEKNTEKLEGISFSRVDYRTLMNI